MNLSNVDKLMIVSELVQISDRLIYEVLMGKIRVYEEN